MPPPLCLKLSDLCSLDLKCKGWTNLQSLWPLKHISNLFPHTSSTHETFAHEVQPCHSCRAESEASVSACQGQGWFLKLFQTLQIKLSKCNCIQRGSRSSSLTRLSRVPRLLSLARAPRMWIGIKTKARMGSPVNRLTRHEAVPESQRERTSRFSSVWDHTAVSPQSCQK